MTCIAARKAQCDGKRAPERLFVLRGYSLARSPRAKRRGRNGDGAREGKRADLVEAQRRRHHEKRRRQHPGAALLARARPQVRHARRRAPRRSGTSERRRRPARALRRPGTAAPRSPCPARSSSAPARGSHTGRRGRPATRCTKMRRCDRADHDEPREAGPPCPASRSPKQPRPASPKPATRAGSCRRRRASRRPSKPPASRRAR